MARSKRAVLNPARDPKMLAFIWKWKISTTRTLASRFFPNTSLLRVYHRLMDLKKAGFLDRVVDSHGSKFLWTLSKRGFQAIRERLPELKEEGFKSESPSHDLLVQAVHLGEWLIEQPKTVVLLTEQQLRRYSKEALPSWTPDIERRRPDGFWRFENGTSAHTIALEVEISRKSDKDYRHIADFYSEASNINEVFWVLLSNKTAQRLEKIFNDSSLRRRHLHNFILRSDFLKYGWQAKIFLGPRQENSLEEIFGHRTPQKAGRKPAERPPHSGVSLILDGRTNPLESSKYTSVPGTPKSV